MDATKLTQGGIHATVFTPRSNQLSPSLRRYVAYPRFDACLICTTIMLQLNDLSFRRGPNLLLEAASVMVYPGHKVGLIGANGCGKSSLFALLRGELPADAGAFTIPAGWEVAHVAQHTPDTERPALEFVLDGDRELREIERDLAAADASGDGLRHGELLGHFEAIGGYDAASRAARLLHGLGFAPGDEQRPVNSYSGGWRMRLALARTLMCRSDLLLLDEPTNHLDLDAVIWLEGWLKSYPGTLLLISHDRDFLDAVASHILHFEHQRLMLYSGNYSGFERQRAERLAQQQSAYTRQQREIAHMHSFVERFRAKASKARQAQSRLKALERMELIAPAHIDSPFRFSFDAAENLPCPLLRLERADAGYGALRILSAVNFSLEPGDRVGLLGRNGAGKSTLIKVLAGELPLLAGHHVCAQELRVGYFAQHQLDQLDRHDTPLGQLRRLDPGATEQVLRNYLGGFGFSGERALEPIAPLSGGEKARLVLALIIRQHPNVLLLDEPTNHLDLEMRHALSEALQAFDGALVVVSHDRHLLRVTTDRLVLVDGGAVRSFDGDLDDYPAWLAGRMTDAAPAAELREGDRKLQRRQSAEARKALQPLRQREKQLAQQLAQLSAQRTALELVLAAPELYAPEQKTQLLARLAEQRQVNADMELVEDAWLEVSEAIEQFSAATDGAERP